MVYVPPDYPGAIPSYAEIWPWQDNIDDVVVACWDAMTKELRAALTELGTNPKGAKADVKTRLDDADTAVGLNTTHRGSDGKDHSDVVLNNTHRASDGKDHSDVVDNTTAIALNTTHRGSDGKDHSDVVDNTTAIALNTTHRGSDGKNHSDVVDNNTHRGSDGKDHSDVVLNNAARHTQNTDTELAELTAGIPFPGVAVPSADPNTLDDYEEFYHVVTITMSGGGTVTLNPANNTVACTRIGRVVHVQGALNISAVDAPVGNMRVSIPLVSAGLTDTAGGTGFGVGSFALNWGANATQLTGNLSEAKNYIDLKGVLNSAAWVDVIPAGGKNFYLNFSYIPA